MIPRCHQVFIALQRHSPVDVPDQAAEAEARAVPGQCHRHGTCGLAPRTGFHNEASMGEVIHVAFGTEREWEQTHEKTVDGLVTIGSLFGDDESLMRAKADCV